MYKNIFIFHLQKNKKLKQEDTIFSWLANIKKFNSTQS